MKLNFIATSVFLVLLCFSHNAFSLSCKDILSKPIGLKDVPRKTEVLDNSTAAYEFKFYLMERAQHSIYISTFNIGTDSVGVRLADILIKKHQEGVDVKVFTDWWGNTPSTRKQVRRMIKAGVDIRYYNPLSKLNKVLRDVYHGKTMSIDGWHTVVGGTNWMLGEFKPGMAWRDTDLYATGLVARDVENSFFEIFDRLKKIAKSPDRARVTYDYRGVSRINDTEFLIQAPYLKKNGIADTRINDRIEEMINQTERGDEIFWQSFSVRIQDQHLNATRKALERGVEVSMLSNSKQVLFNQVFFLLPPLRHIVAYQLYKDATKSYEPLLSLAGQIKLYEFEGPMPMHSKAILIKKKGQMTGIGGVGTYNVSPNSYKRHVETMLFTKNPRTVKQLYELFQGDIGNSQVIKLDSLN